MRTDATIVPRTRDGSAAADRGSLPMAMLVIIVSMSLCALLAPAVINQVVAARTDIQRGRALNAAQAGIDVAVGYLRAASDGAGNGLIERLPPCDLAGGFGPDGSLPTLRYRVKITYRDVGDNPMSCPPIDTPTTALLSSTGSGVSNGGTTAGSAGSRTIDATYTLSNSNAKIPGGAIRIDTSGSSTTLCWDAGSTMPPATDTRVQFQPCVAGASRQQFAYTEDLNLRLVGSESTAVPTGMCLDANTPHATGGYLVFKPCGNRLPRQQWAVGAGVFQGTADGVTTEAGLCLNMQTPRTAGSYLVFGGVCGNTYDTSVHSLASAVGAGMAGASTGQLVNFAYFNYCLDVPNFNVNTLNMFIFPCKQSPDGNVQWNQKWTYPTPVLPASSATGRIRTVRTTDGAGYCLRSPGSTAANLYATLSPCTAAGALAADLQWTMYGDTGDYATSYRIMDANGYCLAPVDVWRNLSVMACSNIDKQKWNAPPNIKGPMPLTNIAEK